MNNEKKSVAILFSGGRDSSLAACIYSLKGFKVHLLSFVTGLGVKNDISNYRVNELKELFPDNILDWKNIPAFGLIRRIAILDIENDFQKHQVNLIPMGAKLAMNTIATVYCVKNNIPILSDGTSGYQAHCPEQMPEAIKIMKSFHAEYNIDYQTPIMEFYSDDEVKYRLFEIGISTKSLEGIPIFAESFSTPTPEVLRNYISEKLPICKDFIKFMTTGEL